MVPSDLPVHVQQLLKEEDVVSALKYQYIQFEFDHRQHLDQVQHRIEQLSSQLEEPVLESSIADTLRAAAISIPRSKTYQLLESREQRLIRLELKWLNEKYKKLRLAQLEEKLREEEAN